MKLKGDNTVTDLFVVGIKAQIRGMQLLKHVNADIISNANNQWWNDYLHTLNGRSKLQAKAMIDAGVTQSSNQNIFKKCKKRT